VKIGILATTVSTADEIERNLPDGHFVRRLQLGRDGFETSSAYACELVIIALSEIPAERALIIAKRMREVAMTVVFTRVPADIDFAQLTPRVDFVVDAVTPVAWRHVLCAAKWDALPRVIRDSDYLVDDEGARTGLHAR